MASWGVELWDKWEAALGQVQDNTSELANFYGKFLTDRAKVERAYAKGLRDLIKTYTPKVNKKDSEELTQRKEFRLLLKELGFQAGQHELMEEAYGKIAHTDIVTKVGESKKEIDQCKKDAKELEKKVNTSYQRLNDAKVKYTRSHYVMENACNAFNKAESDLSCSRIDIEKARLLMERKLKDCHEVKSSYASQVLLTNQEQEHHFYTGLPGVLDRLQTLHQDNSQHLTTVLTKCVNREKEITPIVTKCHDEMLTVLNRIDKEADTQLIIDRLKTGNQPPDEFMFEELRVGEDRNLTPLNNQTKSMSMVGSVQDVKRQSDGNLYQKKRELERQIKVHEDMITKGQKEVAALRLMVETHTLNPQFGSAKQFQNELDTAAHKVSLAEAELSAMQQELSLVTAQLENKRTRKKTAPPSPSGSDRSVKTFASQDSSQSQQDSGVFLSSPMSSATEKAPLEEWDDEECESPPPPPPPMSGATIPEEELPPPPSSYLPLATALYEYEGQGEYNSLSMIPGELFEVLGPDEGGWTMVKRQGGDMEGFVPTSFLQM